MDSNAAPRTLKYVFRKTNGLRALRISLAKEQELDPDLGDELAPPGFVELSP